MSKKKSDLLPEVEGTTDELNPEAPGLGTVEKLYELFDETYEALVEHDGDRFVTCHCCGAAEITEGEDKGKEDHHPLCLVMVLAWYLDVWENDVKPEFDKAKNKSKLDKIAGLRKR